MLYLSSVGAAGLRSSGVHLEMLTFCQGVTMATLGIEGPAREEGMTRCGEGTSLPHEGHWLTALY